jgi:hypothetical protein
MDLPLEQPGCQKGGSVVSEVQKVVEKWTEFATTTGVAEEKAKEYALALGHREIKVE